MRRATRFLVRLYPANWRERYGEEFEALIEDSAPGGWPVFDLMKGAFTMQLKAFSFPKLAVVLSLAGVVCGLGVSMLMPPVYVSTAELQLRSALPGSSDAAPRLKDRVLQMEQQVLSLTSLVMIIQDPRLDLYRREKARQPVQDVIETMRTQDIKIQIMPPGKDSVRFQIRFSYSDPVKAQEVVQMLVTRFSNADVRAAPDAQRASTQASENLDVTDVPTLPTRPTKPKRAIFAALGFVTGFLSAVVLAVFRRRPPAIAFPAQTA